MVASIQELPSSSKCLSSKASSDLIQYGTESLTLSQMLSTIVWTALCYAFVGGYSRPKGLPSSNHPNGPGERSELTVWQRTSCCGSCIGRCNTRSHYRGRADGCRGAAVVPTCLDYLTVHPSQWELTFCLMFIQWATLMGSQSRSRASHKMSRSFITSIPNRKS